MKSSPSSDAQAQIGQLITMKLDEIVPYWRNPRRISDENVNLLAKSIADYGYQQPIVVDVDNVIIVGHTRYTALRRLDVTEVPVLVAKSLTPEQVKQLRIIDNRAAEYTSWDYDKLMDELAQMDAGHALPFFQEVLGDQMDATADEEAYLETKWAQVVPQVEFICPACFHSWEMTVTREALLSGILKVED